MSEYEIEGDVVCPACGSWPLHRRECWCEDGWVWGYDEDPLWYDPDELIPCTECDGVGFELWCPRCGADMRRPEWRAAIEAQWAELDKLYEEAAR